MKWAEVRTEGGRMKCRYIGLAMGAVIAVGAVLSLPSCGHDQKLVSIQVTPVTTVYPSPNSEPADFRAYGTYIHPPETQDITGQVTWVIDVTELFSLAYGGSSVGEAVAPSGGGCGIGNLWATAPEGTGGAGNIIVSNYATLTVDNDNIPTCPGGSSSNGTLVVTPEGMGTGVVTSLPAEITCPGTECSGTFAPGNTITLTATPGANSVFGGWGGCVTSSNPDQCTLSVASGSIVNVTATFNLE